MGLWTSQSPTQQPGRRHRRVCRLSGRRSVVRLRRSVSQRSAFLARSTQRTLQVREGYVPPTLGGPGACDPSSRQAAGSSVSLSPCTILHAVAYGRAGAIPLPVGTRDGSLWDVGGGTPSRCRAAHLILVGLALSPSGVAPSIRASRHGLVRPGPFSPSAFCVAPSPPFWVTSVGRAPQSPGRRGRAGRRHLAQSRFPPAAFTLRALCAWGAFVAFSGNLLKLGGYRISAHWTSRRAALAPVRHPHRGVCRPARFAGLRSSRFARPASSGSLGVFVGPCPSPAARAFDPLAFFHCGALPFVLGLAVCGSCPRRAGVGPVIFAPSLAGVEFVR